MISWGVFQPHLLCVLVNPTATRGPGENEGLELFQTSSETWVILLMPSLTMWGAASSPLHTIRSFIAFLKAINTIHFQDLQSTPVQLLTVLAALSFPFISVERCSPAPAASLLSSLPAARSYLAPVLLAFSWDQRLWKIFIAHEVTPCPLPCFFWFLVFGSLLH